MSWYLVVLKTAFTVVILLVLTRLIGKKQVSQLSLFEYITGITLGSIAAYIPLESEPTSWYLGALSLLVWVIMAFVIEYLEIKSKKMRKWIIGTETVLIKHGKVLEENLKKERMTAIELMSKLRAKNIFNLSEVEFAIMEPDGSVNVMLKKEHQPLTASMLHLPVNREREPEMVIIDGQIEKEVLSRIGKNEKWLLKELEKQGLKLEDVFLAQVDSSGNLWTDLYQDRSSSRSRPHWRANLIQALETCEAELKKSGQLAQDPDEKQMYLNTARDLKEITKDIQSRFLSLS
jgi:uncharacterized membrane protein YcaP (DUF421 family)